ncbi:hypothetical protein MMC14_003929, partial [Varicellaria rhodocarpa]|nr:hypothetical protein [Varicellaria rhodocarpa]
ANNGETQSDLELNNDLASNEPSDSNEASELSFEKDTRSSMEEPERIGHPTIPRSEHVIE